MRLLLLALVIISLVNPDAEAQKYVIEKQAIVSSASGSGNGKFMEYGVIGELISGRSSDSNYTILSDELFFTFNNSISPKAKSSESASLLVYPAVSDKKVNFDVHSTEGEIFDIMIFDIFGNIIHQVCSQTQIDGKKTFSWDLIRKNGDICLSGVYYCVLLSESTYKVNKFIVYR